MTGLATIQNLVERGESETVELKKSTGQLRRAGEALCGFLNGNGGSVILGVKPDGTVAGQEVRDATLQDIAAILDKFDPKAPVSQEIVDVEQGKNVIILTAPAMPESGPFTFDGRAYQRIGNTTSRMPRSRYETLLLNREHSRSRWENAPAEWQETKYLDQEEILRTVRFGIEARRMPESTGNDIADILERLGVGNNGQLLNAAFVLFGNRFMPVYPQCQLRLARFDGNDKSEFLDHRQERGHAFYLLNEAMTFLRRHLPISGRFEQNRMERIDSLIIPALALREALVNAFCHRDYSIQGGAVSVAIFNNRTEIWSDGTLPFGLTAEDLTGEHTSQPRNPIITDVFFRRGLIEQWGRGTQKVVELCEETGCPVPVFEEQAGSLVVRFPVSEKLSSASTVQETIQDAPQDNHLANSGESAYKRKTTPEDTPEGTPQVTPEDKALKTTEKKEEKGVATQDTQSDTPQVTPEVKSLLSIMKNDMARGDLQKAVGLKDPKHFRTAYLQPAIEQGVITMTIPDKPNSSHQRYRLTPKGKQLQKQVKKP